MIETGAFQPSLMESSAFRIRDVPGLKEYEHHVETLALLVLTEPEKIAS